MVSYTPWRRNWVLAAAALCLAAALPAITWMVHGPVWTASAASLVCLLIAWQQLRAAQRRSHGKRLERQKLQEAIHALQGIPQLTLLTSYQMPGRREDIDLLIKGRGGAIPVEIKSFVHWRTYLWFWHGRRERDAIRQSARQQRCVDANLGLIWLPNGRRGFWHRFSQFPKVGRHVHLVFGNADALKKAITEITKIQDKN